MPKLAVIILNWNRADLTLECAASALESFDAANNESIIGRLLVVDNASLPADRARLKAGLACMADREPAPELVLNDSNLGYAGGMNAAISLLADWHPDHVWLLNNDTTVDSSAITALLDFADLHPSAVMLGATMTDSESGLTLAAGGNRYVAALGWSRPCFAGRTPLSLRENTPSPKLDYIDGASLWLKGSFIQRIERIPEENFLYYEELALKQRLNQDEFIAWCPDAVVYHLQGGSTPNPEQEASGAYHAALSAFCYTKKHHPIYLPTVILARVIGVGVRSITQLNPLLIRAVLKALKDFVQTTPPSDYG